MVAQNAQAILEIEQGIFAVLLVEFIGDPVDDDVVPILFTDLLDRLRTRNSCVIHKDID